MPSGSGNPEEAVCSNPRILHRNIEHLSRLALGTARAGCPPALSQHYCDLVLELAEAAGAKVPGDFLDRFCLGCHRLTVPGQNCIFRTVARYPRARKGERGSRLGGRRNPSGTAVAVCCVDCGHRSRLEVPPLRPPPRTPGGPGQDRPPEVDLVPKRRQRLAEALAAAKKARAQGRGADDSRVGSLDFPY